MTTTPAQVAAAYQGILRVPPLGGATGAYAISVAAQINQPGSTLTFAGYEASLISLDQTLYTTLASLVTIDAFYNATPSSALLTTVATATSGTSYFTAAELHNAGYSDANVWTILGAEWAADPNSNFYTLYNGLATGATSDYTTFINAVYLREFGTAPSQANLQNLLNDIPGLITLLSGGGHTATSLQVMGGLFGYLLYAGQSNNIGTYAGPADAFLLAAGNGTVVYGPELTQEFPPPPTFTTFTLTTGQDTFTGTGYDIIYGPQAGPFGNQDTLTDFDHLVATGGPTKPSVLNATLDGHTNINGVTIQGFQTWNLQNDGHGTVNINGGAPTAGSPPNITGLNMLSYNDNGGGASLTVGTALMPIDVAGDLANGFTINLSNALGGYGHIIDVAFAAGVLTPTQTITVNAFSVGNASDNDLGDAYGIAAGYAGNGTPGSAVGFQTWVLNSTGSGLGTVNDIALGGEGSTTARTLNITDDGPTATTIVYASNASGSNGATDWSKLTTINLTGTSGWVTITGAETTPVFNGAGLLALNGAITSILGGTGNSLYDLSSSFYTDAAAHAATIIQGGTGTGGNSEVEFNNAVVAGGFTVNIQNISVLDDSSDIQGGIINMSNFAGLLPTNVPYMLPGDSLTGTVANGGAVAAGFQLLQFLDASSNAGGTLYSDLVINNGFADFAINMQDLNTYHASTDHNITISAGPTINLNDHLQVWVSDEGSVPVFTVNNYTTTDIFLPTEHGNDVVLGSDHFVDQPVVSVTGASLNFYDNSADSGNGSDNLILGKTTGFAGDFTDVGHTSVFLDATAHTYLNDFGAGYFRIGATDATNLNAATTSHLVMDLPATHAFFNSDGITVTGSATGQNLLQGVSGTLTHTLADDGDGQFISSYIGNDQLIGGSGADNFFPEGGNDIVTINAPLGTTDNVWFAAYDVGHSGGTHGTGTGTILTQAVTDIISGTETFVNGYDKDTLTVNHFIWGPTGGDKIQFDEDSWASGGSINGLTKSDGNTQVSSLAHDATFVQEGTANTVLTATADIIEDTISTYANASFLANALGQSAVGNLKLAGSGVAAGATIDLMIAYNDSAGDINIADITFKNTTGGAVTDTSQLHLVHSVDLVHLVGTTGVGAMDAANIHFI